MARVSAWSELILSEIGHAMWRRDSRKIASHPWWWLQQTFSDRTRRFRRWAVMLVILSAGGLLLLLTGLPLPVPLTVTVGAIIGRLLLDEELSMMIVEWDSQGTSLSNKTACQSLSVRLPFFFVFCEWQGESGSGWEIKMRQASNPIKKMSRQSHDQASSQHSEDYRRQWEWLCRRGHC